MPDSFFDSYDEYVVCWDAEEWVITEVDTINGELILMRKESVKDLTLIPDFTKEGN